MNIQFNATARQAEIDAEFDRLQKESEQLRTAIEREKLILGLIELGKIGAWIDISTAHETCIHGELTAKEKEKDGYDIQKKFGLTGYHERIDTDIDEIGRVAFTANDGTTELGFYADVNNLNYDAVKNFLDRYKIKIKTDALKWKLTQKEKEVNELRETIAKFQ